ncbi:linker for activation of T-cells family member 1-like isoform X2 [Heptranchias perlo]|uniref:linker for activation of T-cells family member 1-like isoform X2 n=1 Tax=Heptranchias perlo TaxID=212740 RepID=UPI00355A9739
MEQANAANLFWAIIFIIPAWMVVILCMKCRNGAPTRIAASYDDYIDSKPFTHGPAVSSFTVMRPSNYCPPVSNQLLPPSPLPNSRRSSLLEVKESDNESLPNYENTDLKESSDEEADYNNQNSNYIVVLPNDAPAPSTPVTNKRMTHSHRISSGTMTEDYENLKEEDMGGKQGGSSNYVNIDEMDKEIKRNKESEEEEEDGSDYVNASKCMARD